MQDKLKSSAIDPPFPSKKTAGLLGAMLKLVIRHLNPNHMVELKYILKIKLKIKI